MGTVIESQEPRRKLAMSVAEAARVAGVGRDQVYAALRSGELEGRKWGRRTLITYDALEKFVNGLPRLQLNCGGS